MYIGVVGESPGRRGTATSTNSPVIGNSRKGPKPVRAWLATGVYGTSPARSVYTLQAEATSWACGVSAMVSDGFGGDAGFLGGSLDSAYNGTGSQSEFILVVINMLRPNATQVGSSVSCVLF